MIKLFTHTDLDGVGCAILAKIAFGENVYIEYCNYNEINERVEEYFNNGSEYECHITDISISDELANKIDNSDKLYKLLDHHATAKYLNKYKWCEVEEELENDMKTSGTELYYSWLTGNGHLKRNKVLSRFVEIVRDYDTWRWSTLGEEGVICKQVNDLLYLYGRDKFMNWCLFKLDAETFPTLEETDKLVLNMKQKEIDDYVEEKDKQMFAISLCGKTCGIVFAEKYFSELGNRLCTMHPEIDFVAMIDMNGTVSYRTVKDNIDLGRDVASLFGGGGHPKASGSRFNKEKLQMEVIAHIFK